MAKPEKKSSEELEHLLSQYAEEIQKLSHLYDMSPKRGKSEKMRLKATAKELVRLHVETEDQSVYGIIQSGIEVIRRTIQLVLEYDSDPIQPCSTMDTPRALTYTEIKSLRPDVIRHDQYINDIIKVLQKQSNTSRAIQKLEQLFENFQQVFKTMGIYTEETMIFQKQKHKSELSCSCDSSTSSSDLKLMPPKHPEDDFLESQCQTCASFGDSAEWDLIEPSVISDDAQMKYRINLGSGSYECRRTGLRIECSCDVELEYLIRDWDCVKDIPEMKNFTPCGPLMDVAVLSGKLKAVYLPHFLCLGGPPIEDNVRILHVEESGVSLEKCRLTRFHAELLDHSFSPKGVLLRIGFPVNYHCEALIYQTVNSHLTLHVYLIPSDKKMIEAVQENESGSKVIRKPGPEISFPVMTWFSLKMKSQFHPTIIPEKLQFKYKPMRPNYFEVFIKSPKEDLHFQLMTQNQSECLWDAIIRQGDISSSVTDGGQANILVSNRAVFEILLKHLEDLTEEKLNKFKGHLIHGVGSFEKLPRSKLEKADRCDVVTRMIDLYTEDGAAEVTLIVLEKIQMNNNVKELQEELGKIHVN